MSFIIQRIGDTGVTLNQFKGSALTIGRGTTAQLRSENPSVALEHAVIEASEGGYDLVDRGSITGTYLNGRAIENARLGPGDTIETGDLRVTVQVAEPGKPLFLRVETLGGGGESIEEVAVPVGTRELPMPGAVGEPIKAPKIDYVGSYQLRRGLLSKTSLTIALVIVALGALAVVFRAEQNVVFRPGELSIAHTQVVADGVRLIDENNCTVCHEPFGGATDSKCQVCHKETEHREGLATMGSCGACHAEHRQVLELSQVVERHCTDCHGNLRGSVPAVADLTAANRITGFEVDHPEFKLTRLVDGAPARIEIDSPEARSADSNALKFNHKCHLEGKCNKRPPTASNPNQEVEKLECTSCHEVDAASGEMLAISYESSCARCHPLTFDNRFPPVPHGLDLQTVAGFIANAYSGNESILRMNAAEVSRLFAQGRPQVSVASSIVRNAQRTLEARCQACHELSADGVSVVAPDQAAVKWLDGMKVFDHRSHLNESLKTECVDCHAGASKSEKASDLSLPGIESCTSCHRASGEYAIGGIQTCRTCHYYHKLSRAYGEGWTLRAAEIPVEMKLAAFGSSTSKGRKLKLFGLPFWAAVSLPLGLVVLIGIAGVFVGAARNVAKRPKLPPLPKKKVEPPASAPAPEQREKPDAAVDKPAPTPAPRKPEAKPEVPDSTIAMDLSEIKEEMKLPDPGKTVATEYFGSIVFETGLLEGRRYTIEPERGCYIGRDTNLADVVIEDAKISRRHVWVGVRGDHVIVVDQNSTNGTYLSSEPSTRITEARLSPGDQVILGEQAAVFRYES